MCVRPSFKGRQHYIQGRVQAGFIYTGIPGKTGIGDGIAIPHGKSLAVKRNCISVLKLEQPIQWETLDGLPAQVFIIFAINQKDKDDYFLRLMASVAKKLAQEGTCGKLMGSSTKEDILEAFC